MEACEVCRALRSGQTDLFTAKYWAMYLAWDQTYLGRGFIALKRHCSDVSSLTAEEWTELQLVMRRYEQAVRTAFDAVLFNWSCLMNDAFKVPRPEPHMHWHARPRYARPPQVAGKAFADPNFAHHYDSKANLVVEPEIFDKIITTIKQAAQ